MNNTSGLRPLAAAVLVKPYKPEQVKGSIIIPDSIQSRDNMLEERAVVVAVGPLAWQKEGVARAEVGQRVLVSAYSGYLAKGRDGEQYRFVNDRDIFAAIEEDGHE
jgi:chaperonin GroES